MWRGWPTCCTQVRAVYCRALSAHIRCTYTARKCVRHVIHSLHVLSHAIEAGFRYLSTYLIAGNQRGTSCRISTRISLIASSSGLRISEAMSSEKRKISSSTDQDSVRKKIRIMKEKQPPNTSKRPAAGEEDDDDEWESQRQFKKLDELTKKEKQDILNKYVKTKVFVEALDEATLKRLILVFKKRALKNKEMKVKFPDQPEKFMESEVELHETLQELQIVATNPTNLDLYYFLQKFTYKGILHKIQKEGADTFINALFEQQVCALLVQNLERLDETVTKEDNGVYNTLDIFDELLVFRPDLCADAGKQGLMKWLLRRVKIKTTPIDLNKCYACHLLSILLRHTPENRLLLGDLDGIDVLLQQLASHDPQTAQEHDLNEWYDEINKMNEAIMEDLFNVLCSSLMATVNRDRFLRGEGLQLMNLILRKKKMSLNGSLKVLDHALNGPDGKDNCSKFVDILGLQTIFPLFMKTPTKNRKRMLTAEEDEKHVISIIVSLLKNCKGQQRQTLLSYFTENDYEKVDRLMELHFKYLEKVEEMKKNGKDEDEEESYLRRLDGGLFILQLVDYVLLEVCTGCPPAVTQRVRDLLAQRSLNKIRHIMREYADNLGDAGDTEWKEAEQRRILQLIDKF
ncbi:beta-catenin-like protein 1 isoform X2 [Temnothorax curvispinosus]|uniref:Beta-catenin-like protein 1 n=1 Tax=Temnothorax curvispinosus TaxID=300111 RepID=A0A6J1R1K6_9HYME|nr:beta-catenin-like protein 1 isoform X2 [Temnothorax curvispinosus]